MSPNDDLLALFRAACRAGDPAIALPAHLPAPPRGRTVVVGAGKAAAAMAQTVEACWPAPLTGCVVAPHGQALPTRHIEIIEAAHPVPDAAGVAASERMLTAVRDLGPEDLVLCLLSGGGSSLLSLPAAGLTLADKQTVTKSLLRSGATIREINAVRKHLSAIKGGRLAAAAFPAPVVTLAISDVPGDDPAVIASGPTVADPSCFAEALAVLDRYGITAPPAIRRHLEAARDETPKPGDPRLATVSYHLIATPAMALEAAARAARIAGWNVLILGDAIEGEARDVAEAQATLARSIAAGGHEIRPPAVILSGGETTVTIRGTGRGGRNTEYLLALAIELGGHPGIRALAADTDGIDGMMENAGAIIDPNTLERARRARLEPRMRLDDNDAHGFFAALGDLVMTGPTHTNLNDFRAILVS